MAHEHGPHECYCPSCSYTQEVEEYVKCNTVECPICGDKMRASETGELRTIAQDAEPRESFWRVDNPALWIFVAAGLLVLGTAIPSEWGEK